MIYGDYTWVNEDGTPLQLRREISFSAFVLLYHRVLYIPTTAMFFRRRILDDGQLLNEDLHYAMDFEFFVRLNRLGYRFMHISKVLADFRFHAESKSVAFPERQLAEQEQITRQYSRILRKCSPRWAAPILSGLRTAAAFAVTAKRRYADTTSHNFSRYESRTSMRVLISGLWAAEQPSGICRTVVNLIRCLNLVDPSLEVTLAIGEWQRSYFEESLGLRELRAKVVNVAISNRAYSRNAWYMRELPRIRSSRIRRSRAHLISCSCVHEKFHCPVITTLHDLYPYDRPGNFGFPASAVQPAIPKTGLLNPNESSAFRSSRSSHFASIFWDIR